MVTFSGFVSEKEVLNVTANFCLFSNLNCISCVLKSGFFASLCQLRFLKENTALEFSVTIYTLSSCTFNLLTAPKR